MSSRFAPNCSGWVVQCSGRVSRSTSTATCASSTAPWMVAPSRTNHCLVGPRSNSASWPGWQAALPTLIDDALAFTDPQRLVTMATVFNPLGERGQVIVLTCTPGRYDGIKDAQRIELCA